jgi:hypothetical protein
MIRHVVAWKLAATDSAQKALEGEAISAALTGLLGVVPSIRAISVGANVVSPESNWDVALVVDFDDIAGLEAYQVHPDHVAVATDVVKPLVTARASVDFVI